MAELRVKLESLQVCKVCGRSFQLNKENHYVAREVGKTGVAAIAGGTEPELWDVFDCPNCGCQNKVQPRLRTAEEFCDDAPVCPFPKGGECYCKDTCGPDCEFHPDYNPHPAREEQ